MIDFFGLPIRSPFGLKPKGRKRPIIGTASRDPRFEQIAMGHQVGCHERPVTVATHRDSIAICDAHFNGLVDCRRRRVDNLFDKGIVHRFWIANNRHRRRVHDRVALRKQTQMSDTTQHREAIRAT